MLGPCPTRSPPAAPCTSSPTATASPPGTRTPTRSGSRWTTTSSSPCCGQFGVDATSDDADRRRPCASRLPAALPPTIVLQEGTGRPLPADAEVVLEDGARRAGDRRAAGRPAARLAPGGHRRPGRRARRRAREAAGRPASLGLDAAALRAALGRLLGHRRLRRPRHFAARSATELGAGVLLVNPVQAVGPAHPIERSPYSPVSRRFANPIYLRVTATETFGRPTRPRGGGRLARSGPRRRTDRLRRGLGREDRRPGAALAAPGRELPDGADLRRLRPRSARWPSSTARTGGTGPSRCATRRAPRSRRPAQNWPSASRFHAWLQQLCRSSWPSPRRPAKPG